MNQGHEVWGKRTILLLNSTLIVLLCDMLTATKPVAGCCEVVLKQKKCDLVGTQPHRKL